MPSTRAKHWQLRKARLPCQARPLLMGIVNVTPDSFSDGGRFLDAKAAIAYAIELVEQGADLIDIGGESTRPYADPVEEAEELRRVLPVIEALCERLEVPVSVDTSKPSVAREALAAGAEIINDVTGLTDPAMIEIAARTGAGVCIMHMRGTPRTMQDTPTYDDVLGEVREFLRQRRDTLVQAGVRQDRIAVDPGIGFGKTLQHNLELIRKCEQLHDLDCPVLVGHSRKRFIAEVLGDATSDRTAGTIGTALSLAQRGVQILRVHDVRLVRQALLLFEATGGLEI